MTSTWLPSTTGNSGGGLRRQLPFQVDTTGSVRAVNRASALALVSC
jgi:hypothetical protein